LAASAFTFELLPVLMNTATQLNAKFLATRDGRSSSANANHKQLPAKLDNFGIWKWSRPQSLAGYLYRENSNCIAKARDIVVLKRLVRIAVLSTVCYIYTA
jgi:hypothetical protein